MKQTLLIITALMLIVGCSSPEPINYETTLIEKDDGWYTKDTNKRYSGPVFSLYENGQIKREGNFENGSSTGKWIWYDKNGRKEYEGNSIGGYSYFVVENYSGKVVGKGYEETYKDGRPDGLYTGWYENGQKSGEETFKDGEVISEECWDKDGNKGRKDI